MRLSVCLSVCQCVVKLCLNRYSSYSFFPVLTKLGTRDLHYNTQKTVEHINSKF